MREGESGLEAISDSASAGRIRASARRIQLAALAIAVALSAGALWLASAFE
jgi:hypothetical protein